MKTYNEILNESAQEKSDNRKKACEERIKKGGYEVDSYDYNQTMKSMKTKDDLIEEFEKIELEYEKFFIPSLYENSEVTDERIYKGLNKGFYLYGSVGVGKTYNLYASCRYVKAKTLNPYYKVNNLPNLLAELRSKYNQGEGGEESITDIIENVRLCFIDDFGVEKTTEWNTEIIYRFINYRYENQMKTFFASNLSIPEVAEKYGDRIASRIVEMCEVIKMEGEDKRLKNKNEKI